MIQGFYFTELGVVKHRTNDKAILYGKMTYMNFHIQSHLFDIASSILITDPV